MTAPKADLLDRWPQGFAAEVATVATNCIRRRLEVWDTKLKIASPSCPPIAGEPRWSFTDLVSLALVEQLDMDLGVRASRFSKQALTLALELAVHSTDSWDHTIVITKDDLYFVTAGDGLAFMAATRTSPYTVIHVEPIAKSVLRKVEAHASAHV